MLIFFFCDKKRVGMIVYNKETEGRNHQECHVEDTMHLRQHKGKSNSSLFCFILLYLWYYVLSLEELVEFPWGEDDRLKEHTFQNSLTNIIFVLFIYLLFLRIYRYIYNTNLISSSPANTRGQQYYLQMQFTKTT